MLSISLIGVGVVALANVLMGATTYITNPRRVANFAFGIVCVGLAIWTVANFYADQDLLHALIWTRLSFFIVSLTMVGVFIFVNNFPVRVLSRTYDYLIMLIGVVVAAITWLAPFIPRTELSDGVANVVPGPLYPIFVVYLGAAFIMSMGLIIWSLRHVTGIDLARVRYLLLGLGLMIVVASVPNLILPLIVGENRYAGYGAYASLLFIGFTSYAIVRHRLFSIRIIVARSLTYILLLVTLASAYALLLFSVTSLVLGDVSTPATQNIVSVALAVLLAFTFQPLKHFFEQFTNQLFYRDRYDSQAFLNQMGSVLVSEVKLDNVLHLTLKTICQTMKIESGRFYVLDGSELVKRSLYGGAGGASGFLPSLKHLKKGLIVTDELEPGQVRDTLHNNNVQLVLQLMTEGKLVGYLLLGYKLSGDLYTKQDIEVLQILAQELAVAISNATAYQNIASFNDTLKGKIDTATESLRSSNQTLLGNNLELAKTNKTLLLLRKVDETVLGSVRSEAVVMRKLAKVVAEESGYPFAALYMKNQRGAAMKLMAVEGRIGLPGAQQQVQSYIGKQIGVVDMNAPMARAAESLSIVTTYSLASLLGDQMTKRRADRLQSDLGLKTFFICPLKSSEEVLGMMVVGSSETPEQLGFYQKSLLERLTVVVGIALDNVVLYAKSKEAASRLRNANEHLKDLDHAKDEFISMASHQLRTPLTSLKGYLSMVLEGEAGPITTAQKEFLDFSYSGAQRMVNLITDLLSVSRMSAGKFMIERAPTDLVELAAAEVRQLQQHAKQQGIKLLFEQPEQVYPLVFIDEGKTRQVIMNFVDNALYYTQKGSVTVHMRKTKSDIQLLVTDTGIGVPKSAQSELFTKFYRADNAQNMRPDGTGLGLFLAKRVVEDQGGTIVFTSVEGKGSTFGFTLPLTKEDHGAHH